MSFKSMKSFMKKLLDYDDAHNQLKSITVRDCYVEETLPFAFSKITGSSAPPYDIFQQFHSKGRVKSGYSGEYDSMIEKIFNQLSSLRLKSLV
jgi:hypothetical protein